MYIAPEQKKIFWAFLAALVIFTGIFIVQQNFEFIGYIAVIIVLLLVVLISNKRVHYPTSILWLLFIWAVLHMLGGVEMMNGRVIYTWLIYPLVGEPYSILKYDQITHTFGFFVATLVMFAVLSKYLVRPFGWTAIGIVLAMAGLGLGALNEIVEFMMTVLLPNTNVGGYENTALDLISNFIGAVLAVFYIKVRESGRL